MPELEGAPGRALYNALLWAAVPFGAPWFLAKGALTGKYLPVLPERLGLRPPAELPPPGGTWLHAVSVGEVLAARTLARALGRAGLAPLVLSSTTATGLALARAARQANDVNATLAAPLDYRRPVRRAFDLIQPRALLLLETEIWPNWIAEAARRDVPVALVNARITERSARRYARFSLLFRPLFASLAAVAARSEGDADRAVRLGVPPARVVVTGDLKYDADPPRRSRRELRAEFRLPPEAYVWAAGSVLEGEMDEVVAAFRLLLQAEPRSVLLLAPRKSFAIPALAGALPLVRRTDTVPAVPGGILLLDTLGELKEAYGAADVAFVGGSLVRAGGHNVLEPAAAGLPVLFGPSVENFVVPAMRLMGEGAAFQVAGAGALGEELIRFARDPEARLAAGKRAQAVVESGRGAVGKTVALIRPWLLRKEA